VGQVLPSVPLISAPLSAVARFAARRFARPRRGLAPSVTATATATRDTVVNPNITASIGAAEKLHDDSQASGLSRYILRAGALLFGLVVAALVWAVADSVPNLIIGLMVGILLVMAPALLLVFLAVQRIESPRTLARVLIEAGIGALLSVGLPLLYWWRLRN
jgi:uncharacterized protein YacL